MKHTSRKSVEVPPPQCKRHEREMDEVKAQHERLKDQMRAEHELLKAQLNEQLKQVNARLDRIVLAQSKNGPTNEPVTPDPAQMKTTMSAVDMTPVAVGGGVEKPQALRLVEVQRDGHAVTKRWMHVDEGDE